MGKHKTKKRHHKVILSPPEGEIQMHPAIAYRQQIEPDENIELTAQQIIGKLRRQEISEEEAQRLLEEMVMRVSEPTILQRIFRELFPSLRKSGIRSSGI